MSGFKYRRNIIPFIIFLAVSAFHIFSFTMLLFSMGVGETPPDVFASLATLNILSPVLYVIIIIFITSFNHNFIKKFNIDKFFELKKYPIFLKGYFFKTNINLYIISTGIIVQLIFLFTGSFFNKEVYIADTGLYMSTVIPFLISSIIILYYITFISLYILNYLKFKQFRINKSN